MGLGLLIDYITHYLFLLWKSLLVFFSVNGQYIYVFLLNPGALWIYFEGEVKGKTLRFLAIEIWTSS